ncbi:MULTISPECIES: thiolase domain-containing protein [Pseudomonas]|uniref:thiolase domain-containing protein n=1 Tax=Pseudomonas TaxID=286 RepID=UPI00147450C2|nr:thiolase domain-containing protein [Pseudomonas sp. 7-41]NMX39324.1 thiolase domain-containing protein [Pseudomonas veronii]UHG96167.1 thiolase domain-containing protein [Pseudomonas sp. 7-41]
MSLNAKAVIVGAYEHPGRDLPDRSAQQIHAEVALGALADAGLGLQDIDGFFCTGQLGFGAISLAEYIGLKHLRYTDSTFTGGSSYLCHVGHAALAVASGKCRIALVTQGARVRGIVRGAKLAPDTPEYPFEAPYGETNLGIYALAARRHMHEYGTTARQLAEVKVAAAYHAQFNPNALLQKPVTLDEVLASPFVADPLRRLDCCVVTDGGGAVIVTTPEIAAGLKRQSVQLLGHGEAIKHTMSGRLDMTYTAAVWSGPAAFEEAMVTPADIDYASIYDSFTITVLMTLEDLGFCKKGHGGAFAADGALRIGGRLPINTDGGGLCNNHPGYQGGMIKIIEAVRQLRGEAHPEVQVKNCRLALAHGTGGGISRLCSATLILGRGDA